MSDKFINLDFLNLKAELCQKGLELAKEELDLYGSAKGNICKTCGFVQGTPRNGWDEDYCEHFQRKIDRIMNKKEKDLEPLFWDVVLASTVRLSNE